MRPSYHRGDGRIRGASRPNPPCLHRRPATAGSSLPCLVCAIAENARAVTSVHRVDLVVSNRLKNIKPATPKRTPAKQANQLCVESLSIQPYEIAGEVGRVPDVVDGRNERKDKENTKPSPKRVSNSISNFLRPVSPAYVLDIKPNRTEYAPSSLSIELFQGSESGHVSDSTSTPPPNLESHEAVWEQHCVNTWREKPRSGLAIVSTCLHPRPTSPPKVKSPVLDASVPRPASRPATSNANSSSRGIRRSHSGPAPADTSKHDALRREAGRRCSLRIPSPDSPKDRESLEALRNGNATRKEVKATAGKASWALAVDEGLVFGSWGHESGGGIEGWAVDDGL